MWIQLHRQTDSTRGFGSDECSATAEKRIIYSLPRIAVIEHRSSHALDRFLRAMRCRRILVSAWNIPQRGLFTVTSPMSFAADRIPAWFVLPVVIAPAQDQ